MDYIMKRRYILVLGCASLLTLGSCGEDFLYKSPQGSIDEATLTTSAGVDLLVTNAYANLTENGWGATPFNWTFGGMYGGDANKGSDPGDQSVLNEMELYSTLSTNGYLSEKWSWIYKGVKRVNKAYEVMGNAEDMDASLKTVRGAELAFLRAMFYFEGVKVFGPYIPYFDETVTDNDPKIHNDRDIYADVLKDVDKAIAGLPDKQPEVGRVNKWAALGLKAKILMQKGDLAAAKPILADLLANGQTNAGKHYGLEDNMTNNWSTDFDNKTAESIFEIQFSVDANNNANSGLSLCYPHNSGPGGCCGFYQPSFELVNSFQVDANGLPYLDKSYQSKASVTTIDGNNVPHTDLTVYTDPRLDVSTGRFNVQYMD